MLVCFKNNYISIVYDKSAERLILLDSNGKFIDYFFYVEDLPEDIDIKNEIEFVVNRFKNLSKRDLTKLIKLYFLSIDKVYYNCSQNRIRKLIEKYGEEYINLIGNNVLIVKE